MAVVKDKLSIHGEDLTGRYVVVAKKRFNSKYQDFKYRVVKANCGFGCSATAIGRAVYVTGLIDDENFRVERYNIERFATDEEVEEVKKLKEVK